MRIQKQMDYSRVLIDCIGHNGLVAGGAPRDWFRGFGASDLDLYVFVGSDTEDMIEKMVKAKMEISRRGGTPLWETLGEDKEGVSYYSNHQVKKVIEGYVSFWGEDAQKVQLIFVHGNKFNLTDMFPVNLSEATYDGSKVSYTDAFMAGMRDRIISYEPDTKRTYLQKMQDKFPHFALVPRYHKIDMASRS